jgi:dihydroorotate dehydrogenase (fumarate)
MDLTTTYMGLNLRSPIIVSSSGLTQSISRIKRIADSGAGAVILKSLFEEQLVNDPKTLMEQEDMYFWYPEAVEYLDRFSKKEGIEEYLDLIKEVKATVNIPVLASINCISPVEWTSFAKQICEAGADGLELNIAIFPFSKDVDSQTIENTHLEILKEVKKNCSVPVAVKLGNNFTNIYQITHKLDEAGVDGLVLFNRFYRPDIDINNLSIVSTNIVSAPQESTETLRWISILSNEVSCSLAAATGIHNAGGMIKQLLVGADAVQVASTLYKHGIEYMKTMLEEMIVWMRKFDYTSLDDFKGKMIQKDNAGAFERVQFMKRTMGEME